MDRGFLLRFLLDDPSRRNAMDVPLDTERPANAKCRHRFCVLRVDSYFLDEDLPRGAVVQIGRLGTQR